MTAPEKTTTTAVVDLLVTTDVPAQVRQVRALAVAVRTYPRGFTAAERRLVVDLVRLRPGDDPPTGAPASALPALMVTIGREHPDLSTEQVAVEARRLFHQVLRTRAAALGRTVAVR